MWWLILLLTAGPCVAGWLVGDIVHCLLELRDMRRGSSSLD